MANLFTSQKNRLGPAQRRAMSERPGNAIRPALHRFGMSLHENAVSDPLGRDDVLATIEAALMLADEPLTSKKLAEVAGLANGTEARQYIIKLRDLYDSDQSSFSISELAGGYVLLTRPVYQSWLIRLRRTGHDLRLSPAALETLAVVAYKQPVMRAEIEAVRGVNCVDLLNLLTEKGLIRIAGRHDSLGRPQLFGTTKKFLQVFGLNTLEELPEVEKLRNHSKK